MVFLGACANVGMRQTHSNSEISISNVSEHVGNSFLTLQAGALTKIHRIVKKHDVSPKTAEISEDAKTQQRPRSSRRRSESCPWVWWAASAEAMLSSRGDGSSVSTAFRVRIRRIGILALLPPRIYYYILVRKLLITKSNWI